MNLERFVYFSLDIEGQRDPATRYGFISMGLCVIGDTDKRFYRELKPTSRTYNDFALRIGASQLDCLQPYLKDPAFNPGTAPNYLNPHFDANNVFNLLEKEGEDPEKAMLDLTVWALDVAEGRTPVIITDIADYDYPAIKEYYARFTEFEDRDMNPFGFAGIALKGIWKGHTGNPQANPKTDLSHIVNPRKHHSGADSIYQAELIEELSHRVFGERSPIVTGLDFR